MAGALTKLGFCKSLTKSAVISAPTRIFTRRFGGVKPNKFADEQAGLREITEQKFTLNKSTLPGVFFCFVLFPGVVWSVAQDELEKTAIKEGKPVRKYFPA
uniref:Uncharacterized protein n=1 Tax=Fibrocapsa japonica TaxID=94617 RepID=A0A7S2XZY3_9STRA|mmetsp:Transcript_4952/g.7492  ORF Transcript_4952/g.7492 Transcript_4952/m.7492 type:complete len:101 (+) Transcript_4952:67-369(+)|eukprot:CAMPEP_0113941742 /NCGR_PEP_ID=MMETSP1339-20121228/7590_1 /TAXON_ID=94617 /ORGANISM="Fibrocapsa japonica" /LENGTH=100 /DNA_ID=CAMNT_0000945969 /DNA_START=77 /DNA_END=379 /DNA_ORIENTATION=+ /assembly_acc=CAM_ASM_000762